MDMNITLLGQIVIVSLAFTVAATIWFARRKELHNPAMSILLIFAWLVPVIGPACLLTVLAATKDSAAAEHVERGLN